LVSRLNSMLAEVDLESSQKDTLLALASALGVVVSESGGVSEDEE